MIDIARQRLLTQQIARQTFHTPAEVVAWLGAVQAQDYAGGKWAIGLRLPDATDACVERAIADRTIVRTWPMRGTLHFVAAADVRWMLSLLTPRPITRARTRHRQLELDDVIFRRARLVVTKALQGGRQITRDALYRTLDAAGISPAGQRGIHILGQLAHDGLICFGVREGKQQTFVLLDEWLAPSPALPRDEALATLAQRYFTGHGPATVQDFTWWSGLAPADARAALDSVKPGLLHDEIDGRTYWCADRPSSARTRRIEAHLLPPFDEYLVGYRDRSAALDPGDSEHAPTLLSPTIVIATRVTGTWGRRFEKERAVVSVAPFRELTEPEQRAVGSAVMRYGRFLDVPVVR